MKSLFFSTSNGIFLFLLSSFFSPFNRQTFLSIFNLSFNPSLQNYTFPPHNLSLSMCTSTEFHSSMSTVLLFNKLTHTRKSHSIIVITIVFTSFFTILSPKSFAKISKFIPCSDNSFFLHFRHLSSLCLFNHILFLSVDKANSSFSSFSFYNDHFFTFKPFTHLLPFNASSS